MTEGHSKHHIINKTKRIFLTLIAEKPRVLGALCQEREENQIYVSYYKSHYYRGLVDIQVEMLGKIPGYLSGVQGRTWIKMIDLVASTAKSQGGEH